MENKFTLVELLVVCVLIAILFTLLLPSLSYAREKSKRAVCLSNQRQIFAAVLLYANKNSGKLPSSETDNLLKQESLLFRV